MVELSLVPGCLAFHGVLLGRKLFVGVVVCISCLGLLVCLGLLLLESARTTCFCGYVNVFVMFWLLM